MKSELKASYSYYIVSRSADVLELPSDLLQDFIDIDTETRIPYPAELADGSRGGLRFFFLSPIQWYL